MIGVVNIYFSNYFINGTRDCFRRLKGKRNKFDKALEIVRSLRMLKINNYRYQ